MSKCGWFTSFAFHICIIGLLIHFGSCGKDRGANWRQIRQAADDSNLSIKLTRAFQENVLPHLKWGSTQHGIRSVEPLSLPDFALNNFDIGPLRCDSQVRDFIGNGFSNISSFSFVVQSNGNNNIKSKTLTANFYFPVIEGVTRSGTWCRAGGAPIWKLNEDLGKLQFRIEGFSMSGIFAIRSKSSEAPRLEKVRLDFEDVFAEGNGTLPPSIEIVTNWLQKNVGRDFFRFAVKRGMEEVTPKVFDRFMDANAWKAVLGDSDVFYFVV